MFNVMKNKPKLVQLSATLFQNIFEQNKGFGGRNTFRRICRGVRGVMCSQKGSMVWWARWNGCRWRLSVPAISGNPPTRLQCVELSTTSLQCFTSLTLSLSVMIVPLFFLCSTRSLSVSISTTAWNSLYISLSFSLFHFVPALLQTFTVFRSLSVSYYSSENVEALRFLSLSLSLSLSPPVPCCSLSFAFTLSNSLLSFNLQINQPCMCNGCHIKAFCNKNFKTQLPRQICQNHVKKFCPNIIFVL